MDEKELKEIQVKKNLAKIENRVLVMSGKGGVGKSFVAVNIAYGLALQGNRVGILDIDIHGPSVAKLVGIEGVSIPLDPESGMPAPIKVVSNLYALTVASLIQSEGNALIWRGPLKMALIKQFFSDFDWPELDYLIVDCPPGTGDEPLSVVQILNRVNGAVMVTTPQDIAVMDMHKSIDFAEQLKVPILGVIENMKFFRCPKCREVTEVFSGNRIEKLLKEHSIERLAELEIDPQIAISSDEGRPYIYFYSRTPSANALSVAVERIVEKIQDSKSLTG